MTFKGAVDGCEPTAAGPRGLARWRKESGCTILLGLIVCTDSHGLVLLFAETPKL